jgi:hypothetical protein
MRKNQMENLGFEYDSMHDEFNKSSINKNPGGSARVQLTKNKHRYGKFYWDKITIVYGNGKKPFIEIDTLNGFKISIFQDSFTIRPFEQMDDNCHISNIPNQFDTIEFYGEFKWSINITELRHD